MAWQLGAMLAVAAIPFGIAPAEDNPFSLSLSGSAGRNAQLTTVDGKVIYEHVCQACHMSGGTGAKLGPASYPALAANARFAAKAYPVMLVLNGQGAMPAFGAMMNDEQVAAVVNYVRTNFGNRFRDDVVPAEVAVLRPAVQRPPAELRGR
jgi:mono/diheme cytochrome c family protein